MSGTTYKSRYNNGVLHCRKAPPGKFIFNARLLRTNSDRSVLIVALGAPAKEDMADSDKGCELRLLMQISNQNKRQV